MPDNDNAELQELLETRGNSSLAPKSEGYALDEPDKSKIPTEYTQWVILPNGAFAATGATKTSLPVGAYTLELTSAGLFFQSKKMLTDTLIDLGNSNSLRVIKGINLFWKKKQRFLDHGILFKRGILMWGPPGSGKTATLALLVENLIELGGIVVLVQNPAVAVLALRQLRKIEPDRPLIVVLEDVEEIISSYGEHDLLALLDGEHQTDNVVNIATTNYPELLGARIINRPSRFDEVVKIGMPSLEMRIQYLKHLLKKEVGDYPVNVWAEATDGMSIAHLKELVIAVTCLEQSYDDVIGRLKTMKQVPKSTMYNEDVGFKKKSQPITVSWSAFDTAGKQ